MILVDYRTPTLTLAIPRDGGVDWVTSPPVISLLRVGTNILTTSPLPPPTTLTDKYAVFTGVPRSVIPAAGQYRYIIPSGSGNVRSGLLRAEGEPIELLGYGKSRQRGEYKG